MNLVFTGFMGTGKTSVGKKIAEKLNFKFFDTDTFIEKHSQLTISKIFADLGEEIFRQMESEAIEALSEMDSIIISCGGGAVLNTQNLINLSKNGIIINLSASPEQIFQRIKDDKKRPLLQCQNPLNKIKELLKERKKAYENCDFSFNTDNLTVNEIADMILNDKDIAELLKKGIKK